MRLRTKALALVTIAIILIAASTLDGESDLVIPLVLLLVAGLNTAVIFWDSQQ